MDPTHSQNDLSIIIYLPSTWCKSDSPIHVFSMSRKQKKYETHSLLSEKLQEFMGIILHGEMNHLKILLQELLQESRMYYDYMLRESLAPESM